MRALLRLLRHASLGLGNEDEVGDYYLPAVSQSWLGDRARVRWTQNRLGSDSAPRKIDQRVGQLFCDVIYAWGRDLEAHGMRDPQAQRAEITRVDFDEWTAAMEKYGAGSI